MGRQSFRFGQQLQVARDRFPVICDALFVRCPSDLCFKLIPILLNHEADELLEKPM